MCNAAILSKPLIKSVSYKDLGQVSPPAPGHQPGYTGTETVSL
ncbi:hypothetical protein DES53_106235 [Roseimicrobium gellanilyticum]|uniref:Uncharacterized protein n=1 Tax=Roseimicrobium gellanilyticum TaxID=748857 RepID=A0A366HIE2_9BACT|nr:hypothetical protein DES53_106235 [Roseimicrobium gellanilyticum]